MYPRRSKQKTNENNERLLQAFGAQEKCPVANIMVRRSRLKASVLGKLSDIFIYKL
jgi:hypothetical protein